MLLGLLGVAVTVTLLAGGLATMAWGDGLRQQQRLLPGTTVAGVEVGDRTVADALAAVRAAVAEDLDREVVVTHGERSWTTTPRRLGATSDAARVVTAAFEQTTQAGLVELARLRVGAAGVRAHDVAVQVPDDEVASFVAGIADEVDATRRNATVSWVDGGADVEDACSVRNGGSRSSTGSATVSVSPVIAQIPTATVDEVVPTPGSTGLALDREEARDAVRAALQAGSDRVELELDATQPRITTDSFDEVLLVRHPERRVELYRGGQAVRSWPVAIGTPEYATPTGMFTIGAKRFEPTWHNSSPDGWGSDMPDVIGPGPDNPLGLRALNWNRDGYDTLIRFHGTANVNSIGRAASHGCVRMLNREVIELFDMVETGTVIISVDA